MKRYHKDKYRFYVNETPTKGMSSKYPSYIAPHVEDSEDDGDHFALDQYRSQLLNRNEARLEEERAHILGEYEQRGEERQYLYESASKGDSPSLRDDQIRYYTAHPRRIDGSSASETDQYSDNSHKPDYRPTEHIQHTYDYNHSNEFLDYSRNRRQQFQDHKAKRETGTEIDLKNTDQRAQKQSFRTQETTRNMYDLQHSRIPTVTLGNLNTPQYSRVPTVIPGRVYESQYSGIPVATPRSVNHTQYSRIPTATSGTQYRSRLPLATHTNPYQYQSSDSQYNPDYDEPYPYTANFQNGFREPTIQEDLQSSLYGGEPPPINFYSNPEVRESAEDFPNEVAETEELARSPPSPKFQFDEPINLPMTVDGKGLTSLAVITAKADIAWNEIKRATDAKGSDKFWSCFVPSQRRTFINALEEVEDAVRAAATAIDRDPGLFHQIDPNRTKASWTEAVKGMRELSYALSMLTNACGKDLDIRRCRRHAIRVLSKIVLHFRNLVYGMEREIQRLWVGQDRYGADVNVISMLQHRIDDFINIKARMWDRIRFKKPYTGHTCDAISVN